MRTACAAFMAVFAILLLLRCSAPPVPTQTPEVIVTCTAEGCGVTLSVALTGNVPDDYVLEASTPDGETMSVHCVGAEGVYPEGHFDRTSYPTCTSVGVDFVRFSPDRLAIAVQWGDRQVSQDFEPAYHSEWPNGPACEPECRIGQISFLLPDN
jgi:hypothetical protein